MNAPLMHCPGPWHDAVFAMYNRGHSAAVVANKFRVSIKTVRQVVNWVMQVNAHVALREAGK